MGCPFWTCPIRSTRRSRPWTFGTRRSRSSSAASRQEPSSRTSSSRAVDWWSPCSTRSGSSTSPSPPVRCSRAWPISATSTRSARVSRTIGCWWRGVISGSPSSMLIAAAGSGPGARTTDWTSRMVITRPGLVSPASALLYLMPRDDDGTATHGVRLPLPRDGSATYDDVVGKVLGSPGAFGAILVSSPDRILVSSRAACLESASIGARRGPLAPSSRLTRVRSWEAERRPP